MIVAEVKLQDFEIEFLHFVIGKAVGLDEIDTATKEDILRKVEKAVQDKKRGYKL